MDGREAAVELLTTWGLEPSTVLDLAIRFKSDGTVEAQILLHLDLSKITDVTEMLQKFELVAKP